MYRASATSSSVSQLGYESFLQKKDGDAQHVKGSLNYPIVLVSANRLPWTVEQALESKRGQSVTDCHTDKMHEIKEEVSNNETLLTSHAQILLHYSKQPGSGLPEWEQETPAALRCHKLRLEDSKKVATKQEFRRLTHQQKPVRDALEKNILQIYKKQERFHDYISSQSIWMTQAETRGAHACLWEIRKQLTPVFDKVKSLDEVFTKLDPKYVRFASSKEESVNFGKGQVARPTFNDC
ncbi:hypothetical protein [Variovorax saccharolyticus]|uniref:hypothetical protein n=1 Tax=Variovorax saccharolyticus TaxID=3053516 RepID=UPI002578BF60|nr:hypothetical protein [Variovorax sp. J31P216]MDM0029910.1 hypothetical protein [Variovorax sp. J31P216]